MFLQVGLQIAQGIIENGDVGVEFHLYLLDAGFQLFVQLALLGMLVAQADRGMGEGIQQPSCGVMPLGEEGLVQDGDFEGRDLQAADQGLGPVGNFIVVEDVVEQQGHDFDDHVVAVACAVARAIVLDDPHHIGGTVGQSGRVDAGGLYAECLPATLLEQGQIL